MRCTSLVTKVESLSSSTTAKRLSVTPATGATAFLEGNRRQTKNSEITAPTAAHSTMTSKVTGTKAGNELNGFPPTLSGQSTAVVQNSNHTLKAAPASPSRNTIQGRREGASPIASSNPCTAYGA